MLFGKLMPREGNFFDLFNQHGDRIVEGARAFILLIQNYADPSLREKYTNDVGNAERQADRITAEVNRLLHKTFITPIDREQIHGLINAMDDILDLLQDATETMSLYDVRAMTEDIMRLESLQEDRTLRPQPREHLMANSGKDWDKEMAKIDKQLESISDRCEDVANLIEGVVLENS